MLRVGSRISTAFGSKPNPFASSLTKLKVDGKEYKYYSLPSLGDKKLGTMSKLLKDSLPYSVRVLLESAIRNCDEFEITKQDVNNILNWSTTSKS